MYKGGDTVVTPITRVIEKTVSPDKIAEIYAEVYKEAEKNILRKYLIKTNMWEFVVIERMTDGSCKRVELVAMIVINNIEVQFTHEIDITFDREPIAIADIFIKKFGEYIAKQCVIERFELF